MVNKGALLCASTINTATQVLSVLLGALCCIRIAGVFGGAHTPALSIGWLLLPLLTMFDCVSVFTLSRCRYTAVVVDNRTTQPATDVGWRQARQERANPHANTKYEHSTPIVWRKRLQQ